MERRLMQKKNKKVKVIITVLVVLIIFAVLSPILFSAYIYDSNFSERYETAPWVIRSLDEFDGLNRVRYSFQSNDGQNLVGYKYFKESDAMKGIIIIAHGLSDGGDDAYGDGGHNVYMNVADYFTTNGYVVFAYDAAGTDESEGNSIRGLPQGVVDLDYAIRFIKESGEFKDLPIMLFGHSWGAYSAASVLNIHPDVSAVVMGAGFNQSAQMFVEEGSRAMGSDISPMAPLISLVERIKFGIYASYSSIDGLAASDAGAMIIHSADDDMVSFQNNYLKFYDLYHRDPRFVFVRYEDRGHDYIFHSEASKAYRNQFNEAFDTYINSTGAEVNDELKTDFMEQNGDKNKLYELDSDLMARIVEFYDSHVN